MKVGVLRERVGAALATAMRTRESEAIALTADRAKAVGVALAGMPEEADVVPAELVVSTRSAASVLGFHPEHVRRLIRTGRLPAVRAGGDYRVRVDDLWPLLETKHRPPGRRRRQASPGDEAGPSLSDDRSAPGAS